MESKICPECRGSGIHNDGDEYYTCWACDGFGYIDCCTLDELKASTESKEAVVKESDATSMTWPAACLYVEEDNGQNES